ncbi:hypothetical protein BH23ACT12_BH23ACT12_00040 [soil metagenome]
MALIVVVSHCSLVYELPLSARLVVDTDNPRLLSSSLSS